MCVWGGGGCMSGGGGGGGRVWVGDLRPPSPVICKSHEL